jgi:hypothetical protein
MVGKFLSAAPFKINAATQSEANDQHLQDRNARLFNLRFDESGMKFLNRRPASSPSTQWPPLTFA